MMDTHLRDKLTYRTERLLVEVDKLHQRAVAPLRDFDDRDVDKAIGMIRSRLSDIVDLLEENSNGPQSDL